VLVFFSAADNVVQADEIRTLVKDISDVRMAKLRSSIDVFLRSEATHAKVTTVYCKIALAQNQQYCVRVAF